MELMTPFICFGAVVVLRTFRSFVPTDDAVKKLEPWREKALASGKYFEAPMAVETIAELSIFLGGGMG
jgi:hypothetical protein